MNVGSAVVSFLGGVAVGLLGAMALPSPQAITRAPYESVLCKRGQHGPGGEYAHLRRSTQDLDVMACRDVLDAYRVAFPKAAELLYCSPTPVCP